MLKLLFPGLVLALLFTAGCDRPEVPRNEYGTVVEEFPQFSNASKNLPLPEEVASETDKADIGRK